MGWRPNRDRDGAERIARACHAIDDELTPRPAP